MCQREMIFCSNIPLTLSLWLSSSWSANMMKHFRNAQCDGMSRAVRSAKDFKDKNAVVISSASKIVWGTLKIFICDIETEAAEQKKKIYRYMSMRTERYYWEYTLPEKQCAKRWTVKSVPIEEMLFYWQVSRSISSNTMSTAAKTALEKYYSSQGKTVLMRENAVQ